MGGKKRGEKKSRVDSSGQLIELCELASSISRPCLSLEKDLQISGNYTPRSTATAFRYADTSIASLSSTTFLRLFLKNPCSQLLHIQTNHQVCNYFQQTVSSS